MCLSYLEVDGTVVEDRWCYTLPPCPEDGDCPAGWHCIQRNSPPLIGHCSDGSAGSLCHDNGDCESGLICSTLGTAIGTCA